MPLRIWALQPHSISAGSLFGIIMSRQGYCGIAQTVQVKLFRLYAASLQELKFSNQVNPRILVLRATRELSLQVVAI